MKRKSKTKLITQAAIIAAIYTVLTYLTGVFGLANGAIQCRLSEALCVLPAFLPAAVPGLFIGCFVSNLLTGCVIFDVVFGSVATLLGALGTWLLSKKNTSSYLYPLPAVVANTLIIPFVLKYAYALEESVWYFVITVGIGEIISCGVLGMILYYSLEKKQHYIFRNQ